MLSSKLLKTTTSTTTRRMLGRSLLTSQRVRPNESFGPAIRSMSSTMEEFQKLGYLDEQGLTVFDTLHEMQVRSCQVYAQNELFGTYNPETQAFVYETYEDFGKQVDQCRAVLRDLGIGEYDKVAIISNNRWEWAAIACAAYSLNASLVPMYEAQLPSDWLYILNDSGAKAVFCASDEIYDRVQKEVLPSTPGVQACLCLDGADGEPHAFATAMSQMAVDNSSDKHLIRPPSAQDLANLIYTSGTTGKPKGVELTHENFASNAKGACRTFADNPKDLVRETDKSLAFLPWAHSYGQTCELWMNISMGAGMGVCRGVPVILEDLQLVKPDVLFAVPTLYKKVFDGVHNLMEAAPPLRRSLMKTALDLGRQNVEAKNGLRGPLGPIERLKFSALDRIVLSKIRARFGGNLRHGYVAGAACPTEVLQFMDAIGIPICEGYGLTETSPIICINIPTSRSVGSVGKAIGGVTVHIVDEDGKPVPDGEEGEICCVGPNVMKGYYKNPEATAEVISAAPDGKSRMFHTGDLGRKDKNGWIKVTGRIKEQYKLENGKYVVPTPIEEAIGMSRFIGQVVLHGANRPHNIALLVPEWNLIRTELGIEADVSEEQLANDDRVKALIDNEIEASCKHLKKFEVPSKWALVAPFTAANNMLTPKMSIRRHKVIQAYEDLISHLYGDEPVANATTEEKVDAA